MLLNTERQNQSNVRSRSHCKHILWKPYENFFIKWSCLRQPYHRSPEWSLLSPTDLALPTSFSDTVYKLLITEIFTFFNQTFFWFLNKLTMDHFFFASSILHLNLYGDSCKPMWLFKSFISIHVLVSGTLQWPDFVQYNGISVTPMFLCHF